MSENVPPAGLKISKAAMPTFEVKNETISAHQEKKSKRKLEEVDESDIESRHVKKQSTSEEEPYDELKDRHDLEGYEKISKIGEGTYGVVYKARRKKQRDLVALKKIKLSPYEGLSTTTIRELALLKEAKHERVVELMDTIQREDAIYLVLNYCDINLRKYMDKTGRNGLTLNHIKSFMHQFLSGLNYCHSHRILHRDLKPQNLLIDRQGRLTIADLGLCRAFGVPMRTYTHQVITLWYRPPEILLGSEHYSTAVDMWSAGCIMAEMISFAPLFPGTSQIDQLFRIFRTLGTPTDEMWPHVSELPDYNAQFPPWAGEGLRSKLEKQPQCIDLPESGYDLLKSLLLYDPVTRMSAKKGCEHPFFFEDESLL